MTIATKFLAVLNGVITSFAPVTASVGNAGAGGIVGLNGNGIIDPTLYAQSCTSSTRPTPTVVGESIFDASLNQPIWASSLSPATWVNAAGVPV